MLDKNQINAKIREKEKAIDNFEYDIKQLRKKLTDLSDLLRKIVKLNDDVIDAQTKRINKIGNVERWTVNSRVTGPYSVGMRSMSKTKYSNAMAKIDDAKKRIGRKSDDIEDDISDIKKKIHRLEDEIDDLKKQLRK